MKKNEYVLVFVLRFLTLGNCIWLLAADCRLVTAYWRLPTNSSYQIPMPIFPAVFAGNSFHGASPG